MSSCCDPLILLVMLLIVHAITALPTEVVRKSSFVGHHASTVNTIESRLVRAALSLLRSTNCNTTSFTSQLEQCDYVKTLPTNTFGLHIALPNPMARFRMTLPDRTWVTRRSPSVDAVLVLDPFPNAAFGHLVLVFWVQLKISKEVCHSHRGIHISASTADTPKANMVDCLWWALKPQCHLGSAASTSSSYQMAWPSGSACEILFLPLVGLENDDRRAPNQHLRCRGDVFPGFAPCPQLRRLPRQTMCDPTQTNSQSCEALTDVRSECTYTSRCDHAILLAGGWNDDISLPSVEGVLHDMHDRLIALGLPKDNIQVFFGDGRTSLKKKNLNNVHAAGGMKVAFRQHIQRLCGTPDCLSTILIYLHSPAAFNGDMLLWDMENDGKISADEVYFGEELRQDLSRCHAKRVHLIVEQSYAGSLGKQLIHLPNVAVYGASAEKRHAQAHGAFTRAFLQRDLARECLRTAFQMATQQLINRFGNSSSSSYTHESDTLRQKPTTLFGQECDKLLSNPQAAGCHTLPLHIIQQRQMERRREKRRQS